MTTPLFDYVLGLADDALISAQRMGWWISRAPQLEEDVAMANIGLDQLGQARSLLAYAGQRRGERPDARTTSPTSATSATSATSSWSSATRRDFGVAMARLLMFSAWQSELYAALAGSADPTLAGRRGKAVKEVAYHLDHARHWVVRLGDGTDESHARMQAALDAEWPWIEELFDDSCVDAGLVVDGVAVDPATLRDAVLTRVEAVVAEATLTVPATVSCRADSAGHRARACTPRRWATCSPRCSTSPRSHPEAAW